MSNLYRSILLLLATFLFIVDTINAQPAGTLDLSFNPGLGPNDMILTTVLQPDGKVLIGGRFTTFNGVSRNHIARLNADGSLDNSFNPGSGVNGWVLMICLQLDGKVIIGGGFTTYDGVSRNQIARLNTDGSIDTSFKPAIESGNSISAIAIQPDGKIIFGGGNQGRSGITRLNADGSLDNSFITEYWMAKSSIYALALQPNGKILIGGHFFTNGLYYQYTVYRLNEDGSQDKTFYSESFNYEILALALQPDGKVIVGGSFRTYGPRDTRKSIAILNSDGSLDNTFRDRSLESGDVDLIIPQPDGNFIIGGSFVYNSSLKNVARVTAEGFLDGRFPPIRLDYYHALALQPDGKIIIAGDFTQYNGVNRNSIVRIYGKGCPAFALSPGDLPNVMFNKAYSQTLSAFGGTAPYVYTLSWGSLPAGITLSETGVFSGTSTASGTFTFTIKFTDASGCSGEVGKILTVEQNPDDCFAYKVQDFKQGKTKQGGTIEAIRSNPKQALGAPQDNDTYNFVSLGFGGSITLELAQPLYDANGYAPDFILVETSFGRADQKCFGGGNTFNYPETAVIEVSDGTSWRSLPDSYCRTSFVDIGPVIDNNFKFVKLIRIKDFSNKDYFDKNAEGFDVDGIIVCPQEVEKAFTEYKNARLSGAGLWDAAFYNRAPNEATPETRPLKLYPNPASGPSLTVEYVSVTAQPLDIRVYNAAGIRVRALAETAAEGINAYTLDVSVLAKGLYLIQVRTGGSPPVTARFIRH